MSARTLLVGASHAGLQLAMSLRELGDDGAITLVGEERHPPYERPPLSKAFLDGRQDANSLAFRPPGFFADERIELILGERVTDVRLSSQWPSGSGTAATRSGRQLPFDRLALTVGAAPRRLDLPGSDLEGVCYLRDLDDAALLRSRLATAAHVVVVGGGFIGLEAASVARAQNRHVTVVEAAERLIPRAVAPFVSDFFRAAHERRGMTVLTSTQATGFDGTARVNGVQLAGGSRLRADLVLVGVGIVPRTALAEQLGLECEGGIVVDVNARTSRPSVVAAGDCTVAPNPITGQGLARLESVQNAADQARAAAYSLVGRPRDKRTIPWFWSEQADIMLQIAGLSSGYDELVVRGDPDEERFSVLYYRQGGLIAVDAVNAPADYLAVRRALSTGATIPADKAGDPGVALRTVTLSQSGVT